MPLPNKKPKPIKLCEKEPFLISASPKGLVVGKYMTSHLNPKPTPTQKMFLDVEAKLKILGKQWRNIKRNQTEDNSHGRKVMIDFFREATNYTELKWKSLQERLSQKGANKAKIIEEIGQAEADFNYFWERHRKLITPKRKKEPKEIEIEKAERKLDKSREELKRMQKEYGAQSWQAKKALLDHLQNFKTYLYQESEHLNSLIKNNPDLAKDIKETLNTIESNFKKLAQRIAYLKESL